MLRPILIVVLVTLAKLHFGDGVGSVSRYGSFPRSRFSTAPSPAPAPAPPPEPAPIRSPSFQRTLTPSRSRRFDSSSIPEQPPSPSLSQSRSFNSNPSATQSAPAPWRPRFGTTPLSQQQPQRPQPPPASDSSQNFPPGFLQNLRLGGGRDDLNWGHLVPDLAPGTYMIEVDPDGNPLSPLPPGYRLDPNASGPIDYEEYIANQKRKEEEADPDSHKINTEGEVIEQQLPTGGGNIVIKISGTNITQRKMNKLREFLKKSIDFVFTNTQFKTPIRARFM